MLIAFFFRKQQVKLPSYRVIIKNAGRDSMKNPDMKLLKDKFFSDSTELFIEDCNQTDDKFERRNMLTIVSSAVFLIAGPLFIYFGFYLLTSPFTVKWGPSRSPSACSS